MEKILKGYVFRMYLTEEQKILIEKSIGTSRFIYNYFLNISKECINDRDINASLNIMGKE